MGAFHDYSRLEDVDLLRRAKRDAEAFHELYKRYAVAIDSWLRRNSPDDQVAVELTAETFAQAWYCRKRFKDTGESSVLRWLFGIARNVMLTYHRKEQSTTAAMVRLGVELNILRTEHEDRIDGLSEELELQLEALPEDQRTALELRVIDDLSYAQIAKQLGCSENAARLRVSRSLGAMRERLDSKTITATA